MPIFTVHTAKTNLSRLIAQAEAGEEIIIARGAEPAVKLVPMRQPAPVRQFGALKGALAVTPAFFDPLPDDEYGAWGEYGGAPPER